MFVSDNFKISSGYIICCFIWGSTWLAIRLGLDSFEPFISAGLRFSLAAIFVFILVRYKKIEIKLTRESIKFYTIMGFFSLAIPFALVYWGEQHISSGLTSIVFAVFPFFVIIFSRIFIKNQTIYSSQIIGIMIGFLGIILIFSDSLKFELSNSVLGIAAVLISSAIQGAISVYVKIKGEKYHPLGMNLFPLIIAGVTMLIAAFIFETPASWKFNLAGIGSVVYLALFGTVIAFSVYYWLIKRINVILLSLITFITPIIAVMLGVIILGEKLSSQAIGGSALVLTGVVFNNLYSIKKYLFEKRSRI